MIVGCVESIVMMFVLLVNFWVVLLEMWLVRSILIVMCCWGIFCLYRNILVNLFVFSGLIYVKLGRVGGGEGW